MSDFLTVEDSLQSIFYCLRKDLIDCIVKEEDENIKLGYIITIYHNSSGLASPIKIQYTDAVIARKALDLIKANIDIY